MGSGGGGEKVSGIKEGEQEEGLILTGVLLRAPCLPALISYFDPVRS